MLKNNLISGASSMNVEISSDNAEKFIQYLTLLLEWNEKINLTAITDPSEVVYKHFVDSLSILPVIQKQQASSLLDVGTGAGFPGLPIKIAYPNMRVVLLDSLNKRINFLNEVIETLQLKDITCIHGRAEDFGNHRNYREQFDVVTSRAVAKLSVLLELCLPFVKVGGTFIAMKGPKSEEEINESKHALEVLGGEIEEKREISIPEVEGERNLIIIKKVKSTPEKYPRKAGTPEKKPL